MKRTHWKKFAGMIFVLLLATSASALGWMKAGEPWLGIIMTFAIIGFFAAEVKTNGDEIKISAGPGGISLEEKPKEKEGGN